MICGIIPGNCGAIALLAPDGSLFRTFQMPNNRVRTFHGERNHLDASRLISLLCSHKISHFVVERAVALTSPQPAYSLGFACGILEGILACLKLKPVSIGFSQWRSDLSIPNDYLPACARVADLTRRHWPDERFEMSVAGHRRQLAALLALYAVQMSHLEAMAA